MPFETNRCLSNKCCSRRGPGQEYLKSTLGALISHVVEQDKLVLEINPLKVHFFNKNKIRVLVEAWYPSRWHYDQTNVVGEVVLLQLIVQQLG